jgi:glutamate racemase
MQYDVKMIVIACNTASVHAAEAIADFIAPVPVISMVPPAAAAAIKATKNKHILVMGDTIDHSFRLLCTRHRGDGHFD